MIENRPYTYTIQRKDRQVELAFIPIAEAYQVHARVVPYSVEDIVRNFFLGTTNGGRFDHDVEQMYKFTNATGLELRAIEREIKNFHTIKANSGKK